MQMHHQVDFSFEGIALMSLVWILFTFSALAVAAAFLFYHLSKKQKLQMALLKRGQEDLQFALNSGGMGTWDLDLNTYKISCSEDMLIMWGINPREFKGTRIELQSKVHPEDLVIMNSAIDSAIKAELIYELEYRIRPTPGFTRWIVSRGRYTIFPGQEKAVRFSGVVFDVTDRKEKEKELQLSRKIRDQFFMIVSHELKTPITSLQLINEVNRWDLNTNYPEAFSKEKILQSLNKQQKHLDRINNIINQVLDEGLISKGQIPLMREEFDLSEMVKDVVDQLKTTFESSGVEVLVEAAETALGSWDRFRLEQALLNLLMNAIRYGEGNPVAIQVRVDNDNVYCCIKDQGIGISLEDQSQIFEKFARISESEARGFGLGLFITKNIVLAHGGEIWVESEFGQGASFTIRLPSYV